MLQSVQYHRHSTAMTNFPEDWQLHTVKFHIQFWSSLASEEQTFEVQTTSTQIGIVTSPDFYFFILPCRLIFLLWNAVIEIYFFEWSWKYHVPYRVFCTNTVPCLWGKHKCSVTPRIHEDEHSDGPICKPQVQTGGGKIIIWQREVETFSLHRRSSTQSCS